MLNDIKMMRIDIRSLRAGMCLRGLARTEYDSAEMLIDPAQIITCSREAESYRREGYEYAYIYDQENEKTDWPGSGEFVVFGKEIERARKLKGIATGTVKEFMACAASGKSIDTSQAESVVEEMVGSVFRNKDALLSLSRLKDFDNYTFTHSVNVCILSLAFARHLGYTREEMRTLGLGAILHDVGKMLVPEKILNKPGALSDIEFMKMKGHPTCGAELLRKTSMIRDEVIKVAHQHHEKHDGSGYPLGLAGDEIHPYARIAAISDIYDAMTSKRVYSDKMVPSEVLKDIFALKGSYFEPAVVDAFIVCLGIYPIGSLVKLDNGEIAIVNSVNQSNLLKPQVSVIINRDGKRFAEPYELDFSRGTNREIVASIDTSTLGL